MRQRLFPLLIFFLTRFIFPQTSPIPVSGQILSAENDAPLINCSITAQPGGQGTATDSSGIYVLLLPPGNHSLTFNHLGFETLTKTLAVKATDKRLRLNVSLLPVIIAGKAVTVQEEREEAPALVQEIQQKDIRQMPTVYSDVLRSVKILPGVASNNELSSAYNVRGGNFDENLIYLNGYEIYRPFLLRQGVEENQSLINPDMAVDLRFYGGAFPASLGDRMSSALKVDYSQETPAGFQATVRADFLNAGISVQNANGNLRWSAGLRYANPGLFVDNLQTEGSYRPRYIDGQLLADYRLSASTKVELFALLANNRFNLTPDVWMGNFKFNLFDIRAIDIVYSGDRNYQFSTGLVGLKVDKTFRKKTRLRFSLAYYRTEETEDTDLSGEVLYVENAARREESRIFYLKTRQEFAENRLTLGTWQGQSMLRHKLKSHHLEAGFDLRYSPLENVLNESVVESGDSSLLETPIFENGEQAFTLKSAGGYLQDVITFNEKWEMVAGARLLYYDFNQSLLISPRASLHYQPNLQDQFRFSWGFYYQPPFFYELRNKTEAVAQNLNAQRAIHYIASWEHKFNRPLTFQAEAYFKSLDQLIPYFTDQLKLTYLDENLNKGYTYGFDLLLKGQLVKTMNSWIGYSYLSTKERAIAGGAYQRRLLDQTHNLRVFIQDKAPNYPFLEGHLRMLFGSGFRYFPRIEATDSETGESSLAVDFNERRKFAAYWRFDLGLSASLTLKNKRQLKIVAEVLNVFNHINVAAYSWFKVFPGQPIRTPHIYTRRFFNLGLAMDI